MADVKFNELAIVYRGQTIQIEYFLRGGRRGTVLYLHGLGCYKNDFMGAVDVDRLKPYTLVAFDFPGCGNSPYLANVNLGMDELVEITNIVVSELDLGDVVLIGHSMGGLVGLLYAEKYNEHVKGFIDVEGNLALEDCFFSGKIAGYGSTGFTKEVLERFQRKLAQSDSKALREHAQALGDASEKALFDYSFSMVDYSENGNLISRFSGLQIPKLFIYSVESSGLSYIPKLKDSVCEVVKIPDSSHFMFYDNPKAYYHEVSNFLDKVFAR